MINPDHFVGTVAILSGIFCFFGAYQNQDWFFRFWAARMIESRAGRGMARLFYVGLGTFLLVLGCAIASGWHFPLFEEKDRAAVGKAWAKVPA